MKPVALRFLSIIAAAVLLAALGAIVIKAQPMRNGDRVRAPEFPTGLQWLNTDRPLALSEFKGKFVLLDFWTYCCINCMHVLPELKQLEEKYGDVLVVIGVHSAKFTNERETENIRQAILRYEIRHPVVNDSQMAVWQSYAVNAWPTLCLIDPAGYIVGRVSGEGIFEKFDRIIPGLVKDYESRGLIDRKPVSFHLEPVRLSALSFPGKILADEDSQRLFISDSNHNRILIATLDGVVQETIASGGAGLKDGPFENALLNHPQGLALEGSSLYIADTENHAIRLADLKARTLRTLLGTGRQGRGFNLSGKGPQTALNSPWDLVAVGGKLYIAMAGSHQIYSMDLADGSIRLHAGSGAEGRVDGPLLDAALAQPSGITTDGRRLYFADSESSSIRSADLQPTGEARTIVGEDLFVFGDRDGKGAEVRLQHPLGVTFHAGTLYIADTYNNKIKVITPSDGSSRTFAGTGKRGLADGDSAQFYEPGGLSAARGKLYVADTNNSVIRVIDLSTANVTTLKLTGAPAPALSSQPASSKCEDGVCKPPDNPHP